MFQPVGRKEVSHSTEFNWKTLMESSVVVGAGNDAEQTFSQSFVADVSL